MTEILSILREITKENPKPVIEVLASGINE